MPPKIMMVAGEVSGDKHAAHLARAISARDPGTELYGTGGERMRQAGVDIRVQSSHLGSVGLQESVRYVLPLRKVMTEIRAMTRDRPPDLAVLVDNEGFNGLVAKHLHERGVPYVHFLPPQVWFWGRWRARGIAKHASALIPAFRAEAEIYAREGGRAKWFGHPLLDIVRAGRDSDAVFRSVGLDPSARTVALMPGSRVQEIERLLEPMLDGLDLIRATYPELQAILPLAAVHLLPRLQSTLRRHHAGDRVTLIHENVYTCLSRCDLALLASGTATLEAALLGVPMVAMYRVTPLTYLAARLLVKTRFMALPNILLNRPVIPELAQSSVTPARIAHEALSLLEDGDRRRVVRAGLADVSVQLGEPGTLRRVAEFILEEAYPAARPGLKILA